MSRRVSHRNGPLSPEGRRRLVERCQDRPIAHVAAEMGISRSCASKWVNRYRQHGELGLQDRSSTPHRQPTATSAETVAKIEQLRRNQKWSSSRIAFELTNDGIVISRRTITRHLAHLGLNRRRFIDPNGASNRKPRTIVVRCPGHQVHVDVKKVGRIPDGGGWRTHGRGSSRARNVARRKTKGVRGGYVYLHSAVDGYSRLAYIETLPDEKASTAIGFMHRARAWSPTHGIVSASSASSPTTERATEPTHSSQLCWEPATKEITPYTPRHNGKVERYNRILAEKFLYANTWTSDDERANALGVWNYHRPRSAAGGQPPASQLPAGVTNVISGYN